MMRKNPWPWAIGAAIAGIILTQVVIVSIALDNRPVLESESANGYQSSLVWDDERAAFADSRALGWRLKLDVAGDRVVYHITADGEPVAGLAGNVVLARADGRAQDRDVAVSEPAPGQYVVDPAALPAGLYRARAELVRGAEPNQQRWLDERWVRLP